MVSSALGSSIRRGHRVRLTGPYGTAFLRLGQTNRLILVASGTFGYGAEAKDYCDIEQLGGVVTKSVSWKPRVGNYPRRIVETPTVAVHWLERILVPLRYAGPCIANYKIAPDGSVRFFEINPRFGGSLLQPRQRAELRQALNCIFENAPPRP